MYDIIRGKLDYTVIRTTAQESRAFAVTDVPLKITEHTVKRVARGADDEVHLPMDAHDACNCGNAQQEVKL